MDCCIEEQPLVSVVIPAYNCEKYIADTLDSVINQTYKNLEIIVVNDCSTDGTQDVIMDYCKKDSRIISLKNPENSGVSKTRNKGVEVAKGRWIALIDSDDCWENSKIQKQLDFLYKRQELFCCTGRNLMNKEGRLTGKYIGVKEKISYQDLLKTNCIVCSSVICKKEVLAEFPMGHDEVHEDYLTWLQITKKYGDVCGINEPLVRYRLMQGTKSSNKLKSAKMQYNCYKYVGIEGVRVIFYFLQYAVHGMLKYI